MLEQDMRLAETLQAVQNDMADGGGLVTSFIGIAEVANSTDASATGYMVFAKGTPAMLRGLLEELRTDIEIELKARRDRGE